MLRTLGDKIFYGSGFQSLDLQLGTDLPGLGPLCLTL